MEDAIISAAFIIIGIMLVIYAVGELGIEDILNQITSQMPEGVQLPEGGLSFASPYVLSAIVITFLQNPLLLIMYILGMIFIVAGGFSLVRSLID